MAELVISVLILSMVAVGLLGVIPATIFGLRAAGHRAQAAVLARETLENLRAKGFEGLVDQTLPNRELNRTVYSQRVVISPAIASDGTVIENGCTIEVQVTWKERNELRQHISRATAFRG
jgi:hypothetical protein